MVTYSEFLNKYNGKPIDFDGWYGFQCVDLAQQYNKEVVGGTPFGGNAKDCWNNYDKNKYVQVANTPTGVPLKGDVCIWGPMPGNAYGHIAIFDNGNVNSFVSLDQNWPVGTYTHLQNHNYSYLIGWLHPKTPPVSPLTPREAQIKAIVYSGGDDTTKVAQIKALLPQ